MNKFNLLKQPDRVFAVNETNNIIEDIVTITLTKDSVIPSIQTHEPITKVILKWNQTIERPQDMGKT